jgi:DNA-directed RNA polymerase subunit M/transcription elongation factor TFIIS
MVPKNNGNKIVLICRNCGREIKKFSASRYKITEKARRKGSDIPILEGGRKKSSEEERRYIIDLYGKEVYEVGED